MRISLISTGLLALTIAVATGCGGGGSGGVGSECRGPADCATGLGCLGVNDAPVCGIGPREECPGDLGCGADRCHAIADACSPDGIGSMCGPPCAGDPDCGSGFRCDVGACVAVLCDAGFSCAEREVCDPARITTSTVHARHHGCFAVTCTTDDECGERVCVNGSCQDGPGSCSEPLLVP